MSTAHWGRRLRRCLAFAHRWLGIFGGWLFVLWFASGVVMMYARMPSLDFGERLRRLPPLDLTSARVEPEEAAAAVSGIPQRLRIGTVGDRPVYRFLAANRWHTIYADTGVALDGLDVTLALDLARRFRPECAGSLRYSGRLAEADQWTLQIRQLLPLHRVVCRDSAGTELYLSESTGEVVLTTDRQSRLWGFLGAVVHWLYFTPFRRHSTLWLQALIWTSLAGSLLALSGLALGALRLSPGRKHSPRGRRSASPYVGLLRWHHYAGLLFGLFTFSWVLSGCLSLDPWSWHSGTAPTAEQLRAMRGGTLRLEPLGGGQLREATAVLASSFVVREIEVVQFRGRPFALAYRADSDEDAAASGWSSPTAFLSPVQTLEPGLVEIGGSRPASSSQLDQGELLEAAKEVMPAAALAGFEWLSDYDAYYYDRSRSLPLPVLKTRYDDPGRTWLYLDPQRGLLLRREDRRTRINRWLYRGLHSFDFPWLYHRRPLWDAVVVALLCGGLLSSLTSALPGLRRVRRGLTALARRVSSVIDRRSMSPRSARDRRRRRCREDR